MIASRVSIQPHFERVNAHVDGNRLSYVFDPAERLRLLIDAIDSACESIQIYYYIYADGKAARWLNERLIAAMKRGVTVVLLVDGFGTEDQPDSVFDTLVEHGARFARFQPRYGRRYLIRNHQKMLIVDRTLAIIGGCNIDDSYFYPRADGGCWHDMSVETVGPAAGRLADYFDEFENWLISGKPHWRSLNAILARHSDTEGAVQWLFSGPFPRLSPLTRRVRSDILSASKIDMIFAYFAPNWGFLRKLRRAAGRGRFRLVTAGRSDNETTIAAARHCYRGLLKRDGAVYEYLPSRLHMKLMLADQAVYAGSANFDMRSLYLNTEVALRVEDADLAARLREIVDQHVAHSEQFTTDRLKAQTNLAVRLRRLLAYLVITALDYRIARRLNRDAE